jgi:hypothetical protein
MPESSVQIGDNKFKVVPGYFRGSVDYGGLDLRGAEVRGWAVNAAKRMPAGAFAFLVGGELNAYVAPNLARPDIASGEGANCLLSGFKHFIDIDDIPGRFVLDVDVYALDEEAGMSSRLEKYPPGYHIDLPIRNWQDFGRLIQVPSTRIQHVPTLVYASIHVSNRFKGDFVVRAGAACVIGYRLLEHSSFPPDVFDVFTESLSKLVEWRPDVSPGVFLRWHTSLRLLSGYFAIKNKDYDAAFTHFLEASSFSSSISLWPTSLTNILLGFLLSGYIALCRGNNDEAQKIWSGAEAAFREGCALAKFQNAYAYDELENAVHVAKECHVGRIIASTGGKILDPALGPVGRSIELRNISNLSSLPGGIVDMLEELLIQRTGSLV